MRYSYIAGLIFLLAACTSVHATLHPEVDDLIEKLIIVESNGNNRAVGDRGRAKGCLQIQRGVIRDVNRYAGTRYTHNDAFNRSKAIQICKLYMKMYSQVYTKRTGRAPGLRELAYLWNGGPKAMQYPKYAHKRYWSRVLRVEI